MAYVTVEDASGAIELLCFSRTLERSGSYLKEGEVIVVRGKLSVRDEKAPQILCDFAQPLTREMGEGEEEMPEEPVDNGIKGKTLYIRVPSLDCAQMRHIQLVLTMFIGDSPMKIRVADTGKLLGGTCLIHGAFLKELRRSS